MWNLSSLRVARACRKPGRVARAIARQLPRRGGSPAYGKARRITPPGPRERGELLVADRLVDVVADAVHVLIDAVGCDLLDEVGGGVEDFVAHVLRLFGLDHVVDLVLVLLPAA